jgi:hypothetical protein
MKAWKVEDLESYEGGCTVVFAETRGKAHNLARDTDCCEDAEWCDIRVTRIPEMDKMWKPGKKEMNWWDPDDRIALVKECGWYCLDVDREYCGKCPAAEWCDDYQDWKVDIMEEQE